IHELSDPVAERARHPRHDRLGAAGPFIDVASALGADAPLESVEALFVPQAHEPRRLVGWLNVSSHRGGIGAKPPRPATEQLDHGGEGLEARDLHRAAPTRPPAARSARVPEASVPLAVDAAMAPTGP